MTISPEREATLRFFTFADCRVSSEKVAVLAHDADAPGMDRYRAMCAKLELTDIPELIVVDTPCFSVTNNGKTKEVAGYSKAYNYIRMTKEAYDGFVRGDDIIAEYYVGHEIGHAADSKPSAVTRRSFLNRVTATGIATLTGIAAGVTADRGLHAAGATQPDKKSLFDGIPIAAGAGTLLYSYDRIKAMAKRIEEFAADDNACKIMGGSKVVRALYEDIVRMSPQRDQLMEWKQSFVNEVKNDYAERGEAPPAPEVIDMVYALHFAAANVRPLSLRDCLTGSLYPRDFDRIVRLRSEANPQNITI